MERIKSYCQKLIEISFYLLFFLVPLVFYAKNYELFEYNKMMLTYTLTVVIASAWLLKMAANKKIEVRKTPFDIFLILFLISQVLSTIFSIDVHVSIFGYYSRFHQGLLATISYLILYFAFTSNFPKEKIKNILYASFTSALIVSVWGILEHFGHSISCLAITREFDVSCWVQDVKTRVFATLGQPNWMSAYLAIIIPITIGFATSKKSLNTIYYILTTIFYIAFLYTRSRSGFLGLWIGIFVFLAFFLFKGFKNLQKSFKSLLGTLLLFSLTTFYIGSGISQIDKFTLGALKPSEPEKPSYTAPALEGGGTESSKIRAIVWKGALDILAHYPLFGSGVETFAYSYYQYRPASHNLVSEWDFLYNKAHNEYLNFAATCGFFGIIAYMSFIVSFIVWFLKRLPQEISILEISLFSAWTTILITNFFGFSVVIVALYFYLIPAIVFINRDQKSSFRNVAIKQFSNVAMVIILIFSLFLFYKLFNFYLADINYAEGSSFARNSKYKEAYLSLTNAISKNPGEPVYHDEISNVLSVLAVAFAGQKDDDSAKKFASLALKESKIATTISPNNVTFYKSKTKMFYTLSSLDQSFTPMAIDSLEKASILAPSDPKVKYNLAVLQSKTNNIDKAIQILEDVVNLKPDYREGRYALALLYKDNNQTDKAIESLEYILKYIDPSDSDAKEKLNSWR